MKLASSTRVSIQWTIWIVLFISLSRHAHCLRTESDDAPSVLQALSKDNELQFLRDKFEDREVGRCGFPTSRQGYSAGFAGAFVQFIKNNSDKAVSLVQNDGFLVDLLEELEACGDDKTVWGGGPRAALEMISLVRENYPHLWSESLREYVGGLHSRWQGPCKGSQVPEAFLRGAPDVVTSLQDIVSIQTAFSRYQFVSHITSNIRGFLDLLATDSLTALSTALLNNPMIYTLKGKPTNVNTAGKTPASFVFNGPLMQEHGFLASNHDIYSINRISVHAAEEAAANGMLKSKTFRKRAIFKRIPTDKACLVGGESPPCHYEVDDFMQASWAITKLGFDDEAESDPVYSEFWFPRAPRSAAFGILLHMPALKTASSVLKIIQASRVDPQFALLSHMLLIQTDLDKDANHKVVSTTTFAVPSKEVLKSQLVAKRLCIFDLEYVPMIDDWKTLWQTHGPDLIETWQTSSAWYSDAEDVIANMSTA